MPSQLESADRRLAREVRVQVMPVVSVVVPCLNRARFLVPTIESILQQDYPSVECIVVDGGSDDGSVEILRRYGERVRWISEQDAGHADAINKGWAMSRGEILAWLNADDVYVVPDAVRQAVTYLDAHPEVDAIYGDWAEIDAGGRVLSAVRRPRSWDLRRAVEYCDHTIAQPSSFIRRRVIERVGGLDPVFQQKKDHELWLRVGLAGTIAYVPVTFAYERKCKGLSHRGEGMAEACVALTRKFFAQPGLPAAFQEAAFQRRAWSNTHLVAANYAWLAGFHLSTMAGHLAQAVRADPGNLPYITWRIVRFFLLPKLAPQRIRRWARAVTRPW